MGWPATFFVFCTGFPSQVGRFLRTCNGTKPHLRRYPPSPATVPLTATVLTPTCNGLPWADSVLPLQAVPKYDGMTWNTESATTHQSLASNCLSVTYLQYIPRSKIERGMYYNSHSHNNLAATKKPVLKRGPEKHKLLWSLTS